MNEIEIKRTPDVIGAEIRSLTTQARSITLWFGIEIGRRLQEAKDMLSHGEWLPFLENYTEFSQPTASRFMRLYKEYGADQNSLFGAESKYSTLNNLSISNALRLIAIPEEEREDFAAANDVEHISAHELDALIEQRLAEEREKTKAAENESHEAHKELEELSDKYSALSVVAREQKEELESIEKKNTDELKKARESAAASAAKAQKDAEKAINEAKKEAQKAREEAEAARKDLKQLKDNPEVPQEIMDKIKAQFARAAEAAEERAKEAERKLRMANPEIAVFRVHFDAIQQSISDMIKVLEQVVVSGDAETADKLRRAAKAVLENAMIRIENI